MTILAYFDPKKYALKIMCFSLMLFNQLFIADNKMYRKSNFLFFFFVVLSIEKGYYTKTAEYSVTR